MIQLFLCISRYNKCIRLLDTGQCYYHLQVNYYARFYRRLPFWFATRRAFSWCSLLLFMIKRIGSDLFRGVQITPPNKSIVVHVIDVDDTLTRTPDGFDNTNMTKDEFFDAARDFPAQQAVVELVQMLHSMVASRLLITATASISANTDSVPIVSKSHCTNSRYRPACGFSPRQTGAM